MLILVWKYDCPFYFVLGARAYKISQEIYSYPSHRCHFEHTRTWRRMVSRAQKCFPPSTQVTGKEAGRSYGETTTWSWSLPFCTSSQATEGYFWQSRIANAW
jgi:hypothetical protein